MCSPFARWASAWSSSHRSSSRPARASLSSRTTLSEALAIEPVLATFLVVDGSVEKLENTRATLLGRQVRPGRREHEVCEIEERVGDFGGFGLGWRKHGDASLRSDRAQARDAGLYAHGLLSLFFWFSTYFATRRSRLGSALRRGSRARRSSTVTVVRLHDRMAR